MKVTTENGKYYVNLQAWRIELNEGVADPSRPLPTGNGKDVPEDDLPF